VEGQLKGADEEKEKEREKRDFETEEKEEEVEVDGSDDEEKKEEEKKKEKEKPIIHLCNVKPCRRNCLVASLLLPSHFLASRLLSFKPTTCPYLLLTLTHSGDNISSFLSSPFPFQYFFISPFLYTPTSLPASLSPSLHCPARHEGDALHDTVLFGVIPMKVRGKRGIGELRREMDAMAQVKIGSGGEGGGKIRGIEGRKGGREGGRERGTHGWSFEGISRTVGMVLE